MQRPLWEEINPHRELWLPWRFALSGKNFLIRDDLSFIYADDDHNNRFHYHEMMIIRSLEASRKKLID